MTPFVEMKSLIHYDFERLMDKNNISISTIIKKCLKDRTISTIVYYRIGHYMVMLKNRKRFIKRLLKLLLRPRQDIHIHERAQIGPGLRIYHGSGIVIGKGTIAGNNLTLEHGVTLGNRMGSKRDDWNLFPRLGNNVFIGCGASILGNVSIGNDAKIGADALVLKDVPDNATAIGVPAKIMTDSLI